MYSNSILFTIVSYLHFIECVNILMKSNFPADANPSFLTSAFVTSCSFSFRTLTTLILQIFSIFSPLPNPWHFTHALRTSPALRKLHPSLRVTVFVRSLICCVVRKKLILRGIVYSSDDFLSSTSLSLSGSSVAYCFSVDFDSLLSVISALLSSLST